MRGDCACYWCATVNENPCYEGNMLKGAVSIFKYNLEWENGVLSHYGTVCPGSSDPFYIVTTIKWFTTGHIVYLSKKF